MSEPERLRALEAYEVLDSPPEAAFDRVTRLAAELFDAPMAAITFADAQRAWCKSRVGPEAADWDVQVARQTVLGERTPRDHAPVRFCAAAALVTTDGHALGVLAIADDRTRPALSAREAAQLASLAAIAMDALELRRAQRHATEVQGTLDLLERLVRGPRPSAPDIAEPAREPRRRAG